VGRSEDVRRAKEVYFAQAVIHWRVRSLHGCQKKRTELMYKQASSEIEAMT
jgi:hypothetical protein